ncbi:MAG: outer membrane beta-barrel protein [Prevotella sp.]|nr:outer membrane beta-barrel protein [Prevotella sp.]
MKRFLLLLLLPLAALQTVLAQQIVSGRVVESETGEAAVQATVSLLRADSTLAANTVTNVSGDFQLKAPANGRYLLRVSYVGYDNLVKPVDIGGKPVKMGVLTIRPSSVMLKETQVTGHMAKVTVKEDTFIYNAGAYRTPEGSVVEELVKKLPGAEVASDGSITINGKKVQKVKIDGKEFMTGDTQTALKNLPTSIVEKIKAYDEKSDMSRISGIDDGNETTVLDFGLKPGQNRGFFGNADLAYGTEKRYAGRIMLAQFNSKLRLMGMGNANNVNDRGFSGRGFGGGRQGLQANKMAGLNVNYEERGLIKLDGSIRWNHGDGDTYTRTNSENFVAATFAASRRQNYSRSNSWNAQARVEWTPDTMTNIMFRPTASMSSNDGVAWNTSATFNDDPFTYTTDPLALALNLSVLTRGQQLDDRADSTLLVNYRTGSSLSYGDSKRLGGSLQLNRKLNATGRNITLRLEADYGRQNSQNVSTSEVLLAQLYRTLGKDSTNDYKTNRYNVTPTKSYNYSAQLNYSEPLARATYLQLSYRFQYRFNKSERSTYDFSAPPYTYDYTGYRPEYRYWDGYLERLGPLEGFRDPNLSRFSQYENYIHTADVTLRLVRQKWNFNVGVQVVPQMSHFRQEYRGRSTDTTRVVTNFTPTLRFRYRWNRQHQLRFDYRGSTSQPSMSDLLDIYDDSDPLNITRGNPGLKPSFTQSFRLNYNNYIQSHQRFIGGYLNFQTTSNSISQMVTYNTETGGRTSRPENISGNWNSSANLMFNTAIDTAGYFNVNSTTGFGYSHHVGYVNLNRAALAEKNFTNTTDINERLAASYRNDWIEFELEGAFTYQHSRNHLQPSSNLDTWRFSYGFNTNISLPWGMSLSTDLKMNSRRGYSDTALNTNELVWNAQIGQGFLKGKALTLTLQFYDILQKQSTLSRTINAMQRSDTEYNAITSYAMLHVIYRFNIFGSASARGQMRMRPDGPERGQRQGRGGRGGGGGSRGGGFDGPGF